MTEGDTMEMLKLSTQEFADQGNRLWSSQVSGDGRSCQDRGYSTVGEWQRETNQHLRDSEDPSSFVLRTGHYC